MTFLEKNTGRNASGPKTLDGIFSPFSNGILSSFVHSADYRYFFNRRQFVQFFKNYETVKGENVGKVTLE